MHLIQTLRSQPAPVFLVRVRCRFALDLGHRLFNLADCIQTPAFDQARIRPAVTKKLFLSNAKAIPSEGRLLEFSIDITGIIMLPMSAKAKQARHNKLRSMPGTRTFNDATDGFKTGYEVIAFDRFCFHTVSARAFEQIAAGKLTGGGG